jgi:RimJ/RimL family protein N-acetyltransferase
MHQWHVRAADSEEEVGCWIEERRQEWAREQRAQWAVVAADTDRLMGRVALRSILLDEGVAEVAYRTVALARGQGVAARATTALSRWALDEIGLHRLELMHAVRNGASCRVAAKAGFALEGTKRSAFLHQDGWPATPSTWSSANRSARPDVRCSRAHWPDSRACTRWSSTPCAPGGSASVPRTGPPRYPR